MKTVSKQQRDRNRLRSLEREVARYRSFLISFAGEDAEGAYRPEFVKHVLDAADERPTKTFRGTAQFLNELGRV